MVIQRFFYTVIILFGGLFFGSPALAMNDTVSVKAAVLETRVIHVDTAGHIQKVIGNTSKNITPAVIRNGHTIPLNSAVWAEYEKLLRENGGQLQAGQTYFANSYAPYKQLAAWLLNNPVFNSKLY